MFQIDPLILFLITLFTAVSTIFFCLRTKNIETKLLILMPSFSIFIYSGVGIAFEDVSNKFIINYALVLLCFQGTLWLLVRNVKESPAFKGIYSFLFLNKKLFFVVGSLFYGFLFLSLCYPTFRLNLVWNPPAPSLFDIHAKEDELKEIAGSRISSYAILLIKPFFFVFLSTLIIKGKKYLVILFLLLYYYLDYIQLEYISRNEMVKIILFIYFVSKIRVNADKKLFSHIKIKDIFIMGGLILAMLPFFLWYTSYREGIGATSMAGEGVVDQFLRTECYYPTYYPEIEKQNFYPFSKVFLWILCLPIPSYLFPDKPTIFINYDFTFFLTGRVRGDEHYSVSLPSFVGECMMCFGPYLYFFHAIVISAVCGVIYRVLLKVNATIILRLSLILTLMTIGRGGSVGPLSSFVNGTYFLLLVLLGVYIWNRKLAVVTEKI